MSLYPTDTVSTLRVSPEIVLQAVSEANKELVNGEGRYFRLYDRLVWDKLMESERENC